MPPEKIKIADYTYALPDSAIAYRPAEPRGSSRLLVLKNGVITDSVFNRLPEFIPEKSDIFYNRTRVIQARLVFQISGGAGIEIFCLEPAYGYNGVAWKALIGNRKRWDRRKPLSMNISNGTNSFTLWATEEGSHDGYFIVLFRWEGKACPENFYEVLNLAGHVPLPPYIKRKDEPVDRENYQTVFASEEGSVAAPTAGLHFTEEMLAKLKARHVFPHYLTLHVGAGTFSPVKTATINDHLMHAERFHVDTDLIQSIIRALQNREVTAVGTTVLRTLETLYWIGVKLEKGSTSQDLLLDQWEAYELDDQLEPIHALQNILNYLDKEGKNELNGTTRILICPGYRFKMVNRLITNFHQPGSTLLLLVAAFIGPVWKNVYDYALQHHYRFLSYGDCSVLHLQEF